MVFLIFLLCIGFGYLLWRIQKLEERFNSTLPAPQERPTPAIHKEPTIKEAPSALPVTTPKKTEKPAWEFKMGAWVYTAVGGIALLLGLGFLLRFAIENNLISPTLRVALGLVLGATLLGVGAWLEKSMRSFAHVLIGTGLGAWYLSLYAATMVYSLVPPAIGFILVCAVTMTGIALALRFNTQSLAVFAMIGGYLTPFLLDSRIDSPHAFFVYLLLLNGVMLAISWYKPWRILPGLSFVGTILAYGAWTLGNQSISWYIPFTYLGLLFAEFFARSLFRVSKGNLDPADYLLLCTNPIFFFAALSSWQPEQIETRVWAALLALLFAVIHFGIAAWKERILFIGIGSSFLALAAPLYFEERRWFLLAWTFEALTLGIVADKLKSRGLNLLSHVLFGLAAIGLIDGLGTPTATIAWFNTRILVLVIAIGAFLGMAWFDEQKLLKTKEAQRSALASVHLIITYLLILITVTTEIAAFYKPDQLLWMSTAAVVLGSLAIMGGTWIRSLAIRLCGIATVGIAGLLAIVEAVTYQTDSIFLSPRVLALIICAAILATVHVHLRSAENKIGKDEYSFLKPATWLATNIFLFFLVSVETTNGVRILGGLDQTMQVALSVVWLVYGILLVIYGILGKSILSRGSAVALFGLVTAKVLLIDTAELDNFARFITFISLGGILLIAGFLYNKFKSRIEG